MDARARTSRRRGAEVREALIAAASEEFARAGYSGAQLKRIARAAGTSESGLGRHFSSKEELFTAAVLEPFLSLLDSYSAVFYQLLESPTADRRFFEAFVEQSYDHIAEHRDSVQALIAASGDPHAAAVIGVASERMSATFAQIHALTLTFHEHYGGFTTEHSRLWPGLLAGTIVALTTLEGFFLPQGSDRPDRSEVIDTITEIWTRGIMGDRFESA